MVEIRTTRVSLQVAPDSGNASRLLAARYDDQRISGDGLEITDPPETERAQPCGNHRTRTDVLEGDGSCPWNESISRPDIPEDQIAFRRWRLGFFVFYGALFSLLVTFAVVADRRETSISAAAQMNPATDTLSSLTYSTRRLMEIRMRK